jgi:hypothetical protein
MFKLFWGDVHTVNFRDMHMTLLLVVEDTLLLRGDHYFVTTVIYW